MKFRSVVVLLFLAAICLAEGKRKSKQEIESAIDEFIEEILECQNIPGINLAVVENGEAYLSKGYGVKNLETGELLTNKTLLVIASVTKHFVASLVGIILQESDGVTWDTPVRDVLGDWFYFHESQRSQKATIRDLLSHRMGLPRHDHLRMYGFDARQLMEKLRFLEFSQEWRESPLYNNLMYGVASYVAETLAGGTTWEELARERLFAPLEMNTTTFAHQAVDRWEEEFAKGYITDEDTGEPRVVSLEVTKAYYDTISSPGAISTNSEDMTKWLMMQLNDGQNTEGEQVVPPSVVEMVHTPAAVAMEEPTIKRPEYPVTYSDEKWSLGWLQGYYRGFKKSSHAGSRDGYRSLISLLPDLGMGVFTNNNNENTWARDYIHMYVIDLLLGEEPWVDVDMVCDGGRYHETEPKAGEENARRHLKTGKTQHNNVKHPKDSHQKDAKAAADEDYIGVYGDYAYGNATVFINETSDLLSLNYGAAEWTLMETAEEDVFDAVGVEPFWYWKMTVVFRRSDDVVMEMTLPFESEYDPVFVRGRDMSTAPPPPELCD